MNKHHEKVGKAGCSPEAVPMQLDGQTSICMNAEDEKN